MTNQHGALQILLQLSHRLQQLKVVLGRLAKTNSGVDAHPFRKYASHQTTIHLLLQKLCHFPDDVTVRRILLHCLRRPLNMHQANPGIVQPTDFQHVRIKSQPGNIVDDFSPRLQSLTCDFRFCRVNGDRDSDLCCQLTNNRNRSSQLFIEGDRLSARASRLAADVDESASIAKPA